VQTTAAERIGHDAQSAGTGARASGLRHVPALDGLRGAAVAGVLLFHAGHLVGGYLGVDLFFVLSGFLITSLLLAEWHRTSNIKLLAFWARRARRLLPALFGVLAGVALHAAILAKPAELNQIRGDALATLAYVANWRAIFAGNSYWAQFSAPSPLEHTWSLAIEEQFYLVWPLIVLGVLRWRRGSTRAVLAVSLILAGASGAFMVLRYVPNTDPSRLYLGTDARAAAVLLGASLAAFYAWRGPRRAGRSGVALEAAGWLAALGLLWAWTHLDGQSATLYRGGMFACGVAVVAVIASVTRPGAGPLAKVLSVAPLRALGIISYGVYLWHWPVYVVLDAQRTNLSNVPLTIVRILVTLMIATMSYYLLEQPVRQGTWRRWPVRTWAPVVAVGTAGAVFVATIGGASAGASGLANLPPPPLPPGSSRLMVVGDSVADSLAAGLWAHHDPRPVQVISAALPGCDLTTSRPLVHNVSGHIVTSFPCETNWAADINRYQPDRVLFTFAGDSIRNQDPPCSPHYDDVYRTKLLSGIRLLQARGAQVSIATSAYLMIYPIVPVATARARIDCVNAMTRAVAAQTGASVIDLNGFLCPKGQCLTQLNGKMLRPDGIHYSTAAGRTVGHWLLAQIYDGVGH
jgi:peptidoglycan/LPS O-acetylase OafA/YrhL